MGVFTSPLAKSIKETASKWKLIPGIAGLDLLFIFLFGSLSYFFSALSASHVTNIIESSGRLTVEITGALAQGKLALSALLSDQIIISNLLSILGYMIMFGVFTYVLYISLHGPAWLLSYRIASEKKKSGEFIQRFSILSAKWMGGIAVYTLLLLLFIGIFMLRPTPVVSSNAVNLANITFFYVFICIASLSFAMLYSKTPIRNSLKFIFKHPLRNIFAVLLIALAFYVNFGITFWIFDKLGLTATITGAYIVAFVRFLIAAPLLAWARVYLIELTRN